MLAGGEPEVEVQELVGGHSMGNEVVEARKGFGRFHGLDLVDCPVEPVALAPAGIKGWAQFERSARDRESVGLDVGAVAVAALRGDEDVDAGDATVGGTVMRRQGLGEQEEAAVKGFALFHGLNSSQGNAL